MIIVYPHFEQPEPRHRKTAAIIKLLSQMYKVYHIIIENKTSYHEGLKDIWGQDDMLIIEHDNLPEISLIEEMRICKHGDCTGVYKLCPSHTKLKETSFCLARKIMRDGKIYQWKFQEDMSISRVDCGGFGTCKISKETQLRIKDDFIKGSFTWNQLDIRTAELIGTGYHIHWDPIVGHNCCDEHMQQGGLR